MQELMTVTLAACAYIKKMLNKEQGVGFRVSVKKTGCSGYSYVPQIVTTINPDDAHFNTEDGISIFVDSAWLELLQGIKIDYVEEVQAGLKQKKLIFINPKEGNRCGCGLSFQIE